MNKIQYSEYHTKNLEGLIKGLDWLTAPNNECDKAILVTDKEALRGLFKTLQFPDNAIDLVWNCRKCNLNNSMVDILTDEEIDKLNADMVLVFNPLPHSLSNLLESKKAYSTMHFYVVDNVDKILDICNKYNPNIAGLF